MPVFSNGASCFLGMMMVMSVVMAMAPKKEAPKKRVSKKRAAEPDEPDEPAEEPVPAPKAKAKAKAKAKSKAKADKPLDAEKYKKLYNQMHYGAKSSNADTRAAAEAARAAWDDAGHDLKESILDELQNHKDLKFVPSFVTKKKEAFVTTADHIDGQWCDKFKINEFLHYPLDMLDQYVQALESKDHEDPRSHALGLKMYKFTYNGPETGKKIDTDSRELNCTSKNLNTKMIEGLSSPSEPKEALVKITACEENLRLKVQEKGAQKELQSLQKALSECTMLLAQLKRDPREECQDAHKTHLENLANCQKLCEAVMDNIGMSKATDPQDKEGSKILLEAIRLIRRLC